MSFAHVMDMEMTRRRNRRSDDYTHYGFSSTGKLHKCHRNGLTKCGMGRVFTPFVSEPSSSNKCQRCYHISKPKAQSPYRDLVDKDVKTWCGRIGIKL